MQVTIRGINTGRDAETNFALVVDGVLQTNVNALNQELNGVTHQGVANIGYSPTFDDHLFTVEVHLLDFNQDIYGKKLRVNFIERLRDEIRFSGLEQLSEQIKLDVIRAREILNA